MKIRIEQFFFPALTLLLAFPSIFHLRDFFARHYFFYHSLLTGSAHPSALIRLSDFLWVGLCLSGLMVLHHRGVYPSRWPGLGIVFISFLLLVPFGSTDWLYYFDLAKKTCSGANPYVDLFVKFNPFLDQPYQFIQEQVVPYPPLWVLAVSLIFRLTGGSMFLFFLALKLVTAAAHLANFFLFRFILGRLFPATNPAILAGLYLAQPLFLLESLSMLHFDVVWLCCVLAAIALLVSRRPWAAVAMWSVAVWIKYPALLCLPIFYPGLRDAIRSRRGKIMWLLGAVALFVLIGGISLAPFPAAGAILGGPLTMARWLINSLHLTLALILPSGLAHLALIRVLLALLAGLCLLWVGPALSGRNLPAACAWIVLIMLVFLNLGASVYWPWYSLWPLFFSIPLLPTRWKPLYTISAVFAGLSFLYYPLLLLTGHVHAGFDLKFQALYAVIAHVPPLILLARYGWRDGLRQILPDWKRRLIQWRAGKGV